MKKILGLDLGTGSIGWAVVNERENNEERSSIAGLGVRVNPLTVDEQTNFEKGKPITTNADCGSIMTFPVKGRSRESSTVMLPMICSSSAMAESSNTFSQSSFVRWSIWLDPPLDRKTAPENRRCLSC